MIFSKRLNQFVPVTVEPHSNYIENFGQFIRYKVKDNKITVGHVDIKDTLNGIKVEYIEKYNPELYSGFGNLADRIEVEHCLKRGLSFFEITSEASLNSHALHYLRGKRFYSEKINKKLEEIIKTTPKGQKFDTKALGRQRMYMPFEVIEKYMEIVKKFPLLK